MFALSMASAATSGAVLSMSAGFDSVASLPATSEMVAVTAAVPAASPAAMGVVAVQIRNPPPTTAGAVGKNCRDAPAPSVSVNVGLAASAIVTASEMRNVAVRVLPVLTAGKDEMTTAALTVMSLAVTTMGG